MSNNKTITKTKHARPALGLYGVRVPVSTWTTARKTAKELGMTLQGYVRSALEAANLRHRGKGNGGERDAA